ncbi:excalibur calcium-binding domain-containing protein [Marinobacterium weihaiense]|uniref:Excalibur calcium-binding domain-containing protein n=1 Tax=Marinobacterium weihaiense TaxID=2851016 RepID=A0ABS6M8Q9_9GAMM|nr:excalibur calcium-binding domain-containing protein [Marinobacterium weihaiense]MBV0932669.1 excalibur calcium-binding domain-containing protein [Marinobacterium weihaiense]
MRNIILLGLVGFGVWHYSNQSDSKPVTPRAADSFEQPSFNDADSRFRCDGRQHCSQMTSRAEAEFFTRNCPNTKMDGDGDGIPCENDSRF